MSYIVTIGVSVVDYRDEHGEWLDGDSREIESYVSTDWVVYPDDIAEDGLISATLDMFPREDFEPSTDPLTPDNASEHVYLRGSYTNPYTGHVTETSVWLTGDFTNTDRFEIFKAACEN